MLKVISDKGQFEFDVERLSQLEADDQVSDVSILDSKRTGQGVWFRALVNELTQTGYSEATTVRLSSSEDDYHVEMKLGLILNESLLLYALPDGKPLTKEFGGPIRFMIPNPAACGTAELDACSNVKFVDQIAFLPNG